jgi:hypothetical protein
MVPNRSGSISNKRASIMSGRDSSESKTVSNITGGVLPMLRWVSNSPGMISNGEKNPHH